MHIIYDLLALNIVLAVVILALIPLLFVTKAFIALITKSNGIPINYLTVFKFYCCFLLSGFVVGIFFFVWWEWQSSECGFGYSLIKYSKFCFETELNIFPVGFGTLLLSQLTLFGILLMLFKQNNSIIKKTITTSKAL